jgi:single-strand DNA-binding protein
MKFTPTGQQVTKFSIAASESHTNKEGEKVKKTIWFRITTWGKQAEVCNEYLKKGARVLIEGRLTADESGNPKAYAKKDGTPAACFDVTASTVRFLSPKQSEEHTEQAAPAEEDLPY